MHPTGPFPRRTQVALALSLTLIVSLGAAAQAAPKSVHMALRKPIDPTLKINQRFLSRDARGGEMVDLFVQGTVSPEQLRAQGIEVNTVAGGVITARCPLGMMSTLLAIPGIERLRVAEKCKPYLDQSAPDVTVTSVRTVPPPNFTGQTGAGVVVGMVDGGIDLAHPDFRNTDGTTRLIALWDQTVVGTPPPGFTYGAHWTTAQINAGITGELDTGGHGSHVMGIAAGNGRATGNGVPQHTYVGVAPQADICVVKTDYTTTRIVDGVNYIFQRAAALGKKAVVNLSLGTQDGPHDGTYPFDTMISALTGPGKIVVASAGNAQEDGIHGQRTLAVPTPQNMTLVVPNYVRNPLAGNDYLLFTGWYEGTDQMSLTITSPRGAVIGPVPSFTDLTDVSTIDGYVNVLNGTTGTTNGDNEIYIEIFDAIASSSPRQGTWTFQFTPTSINSTGQIDMYLFANGLGDGFNIVSWSAGLFAGGVIGSPGSADSVITAAAHTTKDCWTSIDASVYCWNPQPPLNNIAPFSSWGPRRDGGLKPDLSAPGFGVASTMSANTTPAASVPLVVPDGVHVMEAGTSMSAPHITGAVALLLAQPTWSGGGSGAIRGRLTQTARADAFTGAVPNVIWGAGKLDVAAALAPLVTLTVTRPTKGQIIAPGRQDSVTVVVAGGMAADSVVLSLSINGGSSYPISLGKITNLASSTPKSLKFFVDPSMMTTQAKVRGTVHSTLFSTFSGTSDSLFLIQVPTGVETTPVASAPRFELGRNAPNPFNPVTAIRFGVDKPGPVTLRIFSAQGALVRKLVDGSMPAGNYTVRWDGKNERGRTVAGGVYLYELASGGRHLTRKMSLLK